MSALLSGKPASGPTASLTSSAKPMNSRSNIGFKKSVKITPQEINLLSTYIYSISGIHIEPGKAYLLETRFNRMLDSEKCKNFSELYHKAKADKSKTIEKKIIDAITTNETLFFRDSNPFELLKQKIIPEVIDKNTKSGQHSAPTPLRIWSAACSTGQEIYSIAIVLKELMISPNKFNIQLIGTDLSDAAIKQASYGLYNKFEIERGLALEKLQRYFTPIGSNWKIKDEIRSMASFSKFNLMDPIARLGKFDIVLCRNVAIYFTLEDRKKLFDKIAGCLNPGGYLLIGSTESLSGVCPRFVPKRHLKSIFYQIK